jgi:hypothetical protein
MSNRLNLKELERKAFKSVHQDGLWDFFFGFLMLSTAVGSTLSEIGVSDPIRIPSYIGVMAVGGVIMFLGKKFITIPRMGLVKFGPARKKKLMTVRIIIAISVVIGFVLFSIPLAIQAAGGNPSDVSGMAIIGLVIFPVNFLVVFGLMAYYMDYSRLYGIAVLFAATILIAEVLEQVTTLAFIGLIAFGLPAAIVLTMGTLVLIKFLREFPLPAEEVEVKVNKEGGD